MDYKALFAAIKVEIDKRKLTMAGLSRECGNETGCMIGNWVTGGFSPANTAACVVFLRLLDRLNIDVQPFSDLETVGGRVEFLRIKNRYTRKKLANLMNISRSSIVNWEGNFQQPRASDNASRLAKVLETTPAYILFGEEKPAPIVAPEKHYTDVEITFEMSHDKPVLRSGLIQIPPLQIVEPKNFMLSTEIAALCGKQHKHVIRDIEAIIENLKDSPDLGSGFKSSTYLAGNGKQEKCYELDYEATMIVLTGYDVVARAKVIKRWQELEKSAPKLEQPTAQLFVPSLDGDLPDAVCNEFKQALNNANRCGFRETRAEQYANEKVKNIHHIDVLKTLVGI